MSSKDDLEVARALQAEYDREAAQGLDANDDDVLFDPTTFQSPPGNRQLHVSGNESMSIVDQRWELLDPSPDVRSMFMEFNERYFWGRLAGCEVRWSPRMTLCAGLCCYEGRGGLCSIRLSTPLLKLRPRKDLVETLLHEMIHAYLFVTDNNKDHDGHGPEFCKHMKRLNTATGTNISIYHTFHDEVDNYRQHWWKCNGPCQKKRPYFGLVKRAMNRAPSKNDMWWADHQRTCGGTYTKIKEPEGYGEKKKGSKRKKEEGADSGNENEKGSKRQATNGEIFPGKGKSIGPGMSSKPTLLQLWIAEQKSKQKDGSSSGQKTKPPAALGAPPSSGQSSKTVPPSTKTSSGQSSKTTPSITGPSSHSNSKSADGKSEKTPLQKWISANSDKSVSKSPPSATSTPSSSKVNGIVDKNKKRTNVNGNPFVNPHVVKKYGKDAPSMKDKHQRKGSGKRKELLAIFDSDSDSDDELFKVPPKRKRNITGSNFPSPSTTPSPSSTKNPSPLFSVVSGGHNRTPLSGRSGVPGGNIVGGLDKRCITNPGQARLPATNSTFPNPALVNRHSSTSSISSQSDTSPSSYVRPKPLFSGSNIAAPINPYRPNASMGSAGGFRPVAGNTTFSGSGSSQPSGSNYMGGHVPHNSSAGPSAGVVTKTVPCPVCTMNVPELDINAHLDMCLS